jgi:hypothetical protein
LKNNISLELKSVDSLEKAKSVPCVFNNWAVFYNKQFKTLHLLNEGHLKKMLMDSDPRLGATSGNAEVQTKKIKETGL